mmetsp:Transcript_12090/g.22382  ORF Transcript_12090/g.22382 Transcript_12090/m.22382 type:complete len:237 (-) Transcript_12090:2727-3437(-)
MCTPLTFKNFTECRVSKSSKSFPRQSLPPTSLSLLSLSLSLLSLSLSLSLAIRDINIRTWLLAVISSFATSGPPATASCSFTSPLSLLQLLLLSSSLSSNEAGLSLSIAKISPLNCSAAPAPGKVLYSSVSSSLSSSSSTSTSDFSSSFCTSFFSAASFPSLQAPSVVTSAGATVDSLRFFMLLNFDSPTRCAALTNFALRILAFTSSFDIRACRPTLYSFCIRSKMFRPATNRTT